MFQSNGVKSLKPAIRQNHSRMSECSLMSSNWSKNCQRWLLSERWQKEVTKKNGYRYNIGEAFTDVAVLALTCDEAQREQSAEDLLRARLPVSFEIAQLLSSALVAGLKVGLGQFASEAFQSVSAFEDDDVLQLPLLPLDQGSSGVESVSVVSGPGSGKRRRRRRHAAVSQPQAVSQPGFQPSCHVSPATWMDCAFRPPVVPTGVVCFQPESLPTVYLLPPVVQLRDFSAPVCDFPGSPGPTDDGWTVTGEWK